MGADHPRLQRPIPPARAAGRRDGGREVNPGAPASRGRSEDGPCRRAVTCLGRPKVPYRSRETALGLATESLLFVGLRGDD